MKVNNKVLMTIVIVVLLVFVGLTAYFKANPRTNISEDATPASALDSQSTNVTVLEDETGTTFDFFRNFVYSVPNDVTEPRFGLTIYGACKFKTGSDPIEFIPGPDGSLYTLNVVPNWNPSMDTSTVTANYESTFTNVEYIEEENKVVIYFSGTFTFSDGTNTFTHDVSENFEMKLDEYIN